MNFAVGRTPSYHSRESRSDILLIYLPLGFPGGISGKESSCQCRQSMELQRVGHDWAWLNFTCGILVPWPGWNAHSLHWKLKVLTIGLPGKSNNILFLKLINRDFPVGPVVRNPPSNAGNSGSIPGQGTKIPHLSPQLSPGPTSREDPVQPKLIN